MTHKTLWKILSLTLVLLMVATGALAAPVLDDLRQLPLSFVSFRPGIPDFLRR